MATGSEGFRQFLCFSLGGGGGRQISSREFPLLHSSYLTKSLTTRGQLHVICLPSCRLISDWTVAFWPVKKKMTRDKIYTYIYTGEFSPWRPFGGNSENVNSSRVAINSRANYLSRGREQDEGGPGHTVWRAVSSPRVP